jgi:hypothetical protein
MRTAARPSAGNDIIVAVAIDVSRGDSDSAPEPRIVGVVIRELRKGTTVENSHVRPSTRSGSNDDIFNSIAVHIAAGD